MKDTTSKIKAIENMAVVKGKLDNEYRLGKKILYDVNVSFESHLNTMTNNINKRFEVVVLTFEEKIQHLTNRIISQQEEILKLREALEKAIANKLKVGFRK